MVFASLVVQVSHRPAPDIAGADGKKGIKIITLRAREISGPIRNMACPLLIPIYQTAPVGRQFQR